MRWHPRRTLRLVLVATMFLFVLLNLHIMLNTSEARLNYHDLPLVASGTLDVQGTIFQQESQNSEGYTPPHILVSLARPLHPKIVILRDSNASQQLASYHGPKPDLNITDLELVKQEIERLNKDQYVFNVDKFGLTLGAESIVIVVQAHDRVDHLRFLLQSLGKVRGIEQVLLIVSHDVYSESMNDLVRNVTFCPILQIFFPYSQQIYHSRFPGEDPNDCPRDIKKEEAISKKCNNAEHPDKYGHYREAKFCQVKHHWIWKLHFVFEKVHLLNEYDGHVLLLEDDYIVSEDILFSLQMMHSTRNRDCPDCRMLVLGNYDKAQPFNSHGGKVERAYWISSRHNMGMAFTRSLWTEIKKCYKEFCDFDDYNWDWTLQHLSMSCIPDKIRLLKMKATRVFHIGECGLHTKSKNCDPLGKVKMVEELLSKIREYLFPNTISIDGELRMKLRDPKANGGWGDIRDRNMCKSFFDSSLSAFS